MGCVNSVVHHKTFDLQARPSLRTPQAEETLAEILADEPQWRELFEVLPVEFDVSPN